MISVREYLLFVKDCFLDLELLCFIFFFSSRRRHTRLQGDWSSDVCSSDLREHAPAAFRAYDRSLTHSPPRDRHVTQSPHSSCTGPVQSAQLQSSGTRRSHASP